MRLKCANTQAEKLVHRMDRCGSVYGDLGLALFKACKAEEMEGLHLAHFTGTVSVPDVSGCVCVCVLDVVLECSSHSALRSLL